MSNLPTSLDQPHAPPVGWWPRLDQWLDRASEKLNPILVKEARQALKSRQFVVTFTLLLLCGLTWTFVGVAMLMPGIYYKPSGAFMLAGYYAILTVPMLLIVPFTAYRSLAGEREDGTYEMLSITTLSSRHIVTGKLGSALLQMLVYYSALSPCVAFTYLLRGIDVVTIVILLVHMFWVSVLVSAIGLMVATLSRLRHVQVLLSVALLIGLLTVTITWWVWTTAFIGESNVVPLIDAEVWIVQAMIISLGISYIVFFVLVAAAQLSFASDNRATRLRAVMLVQQTLFVGWMAYFWVDDGFPGFLYVLLTVAAVHWMTAGAFMTGEWAQLSPRVQRALPQSFLGRCLLTWFNPGSGTGYVFAVANMAALVLLAVVMAAVGEAFGLMRQWGTSWAASECAMYGLMLWSYLTAYLGLGRLVLLWLRRYVYLPVLMPLIVHALLLAVGAVVPFFVQSWLLGFQGMDDYTPLQIPNWFWTLMETGEGNSPAVMTAVIPVVGMAMLMLLVNLAVAAREVEQVRQEAPVRVQLDDLELRPQRPPAKKRPTSPFEDA
jgi:hypothetical protein